MGATIARRVTPIVHTSTCMYYRRQLRHICARADPHLRQGGGGYLASCLVRLAPDDLRSSGR
jgi:hypothetical protein